MKHYNIDKLLSDSFDKHGAFFAFSNSQFEENMKEGVKYCSVGSGLICPKDNVKSLLESNQKIIHDKIQWELANNTREEIIMYELANHECQFTSHDEIIDLMSEYGITEEEIKEVYPKYIDHCIENDYF